MCQSNLLNFKLLTSKLYQYDRMRHDLLKIYNLYKTRFANLTIKALKSEFM